MTDQDMLDRGVRAEELLSSEVFGLAIKDIVDFHLNVFLTSKPEADKLRESSYFQANAIQQVISVLQEWVAIKESIKTNLNTVEE